MQAGPRRRPGPGRPARVGRWQTAGMEPFALRTERLVLTAPTLDDVDRITQVCQDREVQRWTSLPSPYLRQHAVDFVTGLVAGGWERDTEYTWAVREPAQGTGPATVGDGGPVLGMIGLMVQPGRSALLGYWLSAEARGRGYMTEAARVVVDWGFDPEGLGLDRLAWDAVVGNWPSRRVAWRLGFRVEGTVRGYHHGIDGDRRVDGWLGTLLASDPREPVEPWPADAPSPITAVWPE